MMSSLGYVSRSTSPAEEISSGTVEDSDSPWPRGLMKPPSPQKDLRIDVLRATENSPHPALGEPFQYQYDAAEPLTSPDFNSITQLPTPVLPAGTFQQPFPSSAVQTSPVKAGALDIRKRNTIPAHPGSAVAPRGRIVSAIDPEPQNIVKKYTDPRSPRAPPSPTRHISNPVVMPASAPGPDMPSPPPDIEESTKSNSNISAYRGRVLLAPASGHSYVCEEVIGTGAFSTVVSARSTADARRVVAVKIVTYPRDDCTSLSSLRAFIVRELAILTHVHHPCIIELVDYRVEPPLSAAQLRTAYEQPAGASGSSPEDLSALAETEQYFFLEFCAGGNLFAWLEANYAAGSYTSAFWRLAARIVAEVVVAVAHMHRHRVVHRDIKLENVLLNAPFDCLAPGAGADPDPRMAARPMATITDFGLSKRLAHASQLLSTKCGSQDYVSPELLMGLEYSGQLLDAWATGVLVYCMIENRLPFDAPPPEFAQAAGISPSVLRRRRNKHSPAHRIAMIDWDWYRAAAMQQDAALAPEAKKIMRNLQELVGALLVRKEKRMSLADVLESDKFAWIKASVPSHFYA